METWFRSKTTELSGGQKQLMNLASALAMGPRLLILDEPTSMLDPLAARNLLATVQRINRELGVAILLTEHRLDEVFPAADRVVTMDQGRILSDGAPAEIARQLSGSAERAVSISDFPPPSAFQRIGANGRSTPDGTGRPPPSGAAAAHRGGGFRA